MIDFTAFGPLEWSDHVSEYGVPYREADITAWAETYVPDLEADASGVTLRQYPKTIILGVSYMDGPEEMGSGGYDDIKEMMDLIQQITIVSKFTRAEFNEKDCAAALWRIIRQIWERS